jgi:hypothetical protein
MQVPDFNKIQDEAKFRLEVKKNLIRKGLKLDTNLRNTLTTEELLKLQDELENKGELKC